MVEAPTVVLTVVPWEAVEAGALAAVLVPGATMCGP